MDRKQVILEHCKEAHTLTEQCYIEHPAVKGSQEWLDKRKYLVADLSLHMVQAALQEENPDPARIRRYLYSLLTICADFIPETDLHGMAENLLDQQKPE